MGRIQVTWTRGRIKPIEPISPIKPIRPIEPLGAPVDIADWLKEHEGRDASCVLRIWGLDGDYVDFTAWSEDGAIRVEPVA